MQIYKMAGFLDVVYDLCRSRVGDTLNNASDKIILLAYRYYPSRLLFTNVRGV